MTNQETTGMQAFLSDCCILREAPGHRAPFHLLHKAYVKWAERTGAPALTCPAFTKRMKEVPGVGESRSFETVFCTGVRLTPDMMEQCRWAPGERTTI